MTSSSLVASCPTFRFGDYPWWSRLYCGLRYFPRALRAIKSRQLAPTYSFHFLNEQGQAIGISAGPIRYRAGPEDLNRLERHLLQLEDRRFFSHFGLDHRAIARALLANVRGLGVLQGGSTITQQLVRNTLLVPERSLLRKVFEAILAVVVEKHYSKREILELYFDHVYLGKGIRGFPAAAKVIFRRNLSNLSEIEICGLLGLLRKPTITYPAKNPAQFLARQNKVANILHIPAPDASAHRPAPNPVNINNHKRPRFSQIVTSELFALDRDRFREVRSVGLTIDGSIQHALAGELRAVATLPDVDAVAGLIVSTRTADVLGEAGYYRGSEAESSYAYFGLLQPGSTFKTFALLSALQQGIPLDQPLLSAPFESTCYKSRGKEPWRVRNYANEYRGLISLQEAFRYSDNTAFARLAELLDLRRLFDVYRAFGLCAESHASPAIVLGAHKIGVSLLSLVAAYRAVATGGVYIHPRIIKYAELRDGSLLLSPRRAACGLVNEFQALRDLKLALLGAGPRVLGVKLAGKTGTTRTGSLFAGYNDDIAAAIWVGYRRVIRENDPKAIGAVSVFERVMNRLLGHSADLLSI